MILDTCSIIKDATSVAQLDPIRQVQHVHLVFQIVLFAMIVFLVKDVMIQLSTLEYCVLQVA